MRWCQNRGVSMQVPAPVEYERALSVEEAIALLVKHGSESRLIAGGHSLLPMMKLRLARPEVVIDINPLAGALSYVRREGDELAIGAMTRHADLLASALVSEHAPIIAEAERVIADPVVRNRGTVGGSLCQADPAEDLSAVFAALGATVRIRGPRGERSVDIDSFHTGPYTTVVEPDEILTEVRVRIHPGASSAYEKVERRVGDWAIAAAGAMLQVSGAAITSARIGLAAVGAEAFRAPRAEALLSGKEGSPELFAAAGAEAGRECNPHSDQRGPEDYKRHLVSVLTERALSRAYARASGGAAR